MRSPALTLGASAFLLAVLGGVTSGLSSFLAFGLAAVHGALALRIEEGNPRRKPRGLIAAGVATLPVARSDSFVASAASRPAARSG